MTPIEVTLQVFDRFGAGDIPGILEWLHPAVTIDFYGPEVIPYAGHYEGAAGATDFFRTVLDSVDIHVFEPEQFFSEDNMVAVTGHLHLTARSTGKEIVSEFAHIITVSGDKWIRFRDFMNTAVAQAAFTP